MFSTNVKLEILLSLVYFNFYHCTKYYNKNVPGCYGINDEESDSGKSNDTDSPTELWFCDACKTGVQPVSLFFQTFCYDINNYVVPVNVHTCTSPPRSDFF